MEKRKIICIIVLNIINLLNYIDRFTVAGVLTDVQHFYNINDSQGGLLQTVFIVFFMTISPLCGYLGDRYNRKLIMLVGLVVWVSAVLASSFIPMDHFTVFVLLRGVVGIGEASYAVLSPTMIADMFAGKMRSLMLMIFYLNIPVGSGLGYIIGSKVTSLAKSISHLDKCEHCWQWGIRVTPVAGLICIITLILFVQEPVRGEAERQESDPLISQSPTQKYGGRGKNSTKTPSNPQMKCCQVAQIHLQSFWSDLLYLVKNGTFIWSTIGYTAVVFVTGTISWWGPASIKHAKAWNLHLNETGQLTDDDKDSIAFKFGICTMLAGIFGVCLGSFIAQSWKSGKWCFARLATPKADPLVSAAGSFLAAPLMFLAFLMIPKSDLATWFIIFFTVLCLCFNWAINTDMLMNIVIPERRSIASAVQILISHLFGDASGPYIVGAISDSVRGDRDDPEHRFKSLIVAFYLPNGLLLLSAAAFVVSAFTLPIALRRVSENRPAECRTAREPEHSTIVVTTDDYLSSNESATAISAGHSNGAFEKEAAIAEVLKET